MDKTENNSFIDRSLEAKDIIKHDSEIIRYENDEYYEYIDLYFNDRSIIKFIFHCGEKTEGKRKFECITKSKIDNKLDAMRLRDYYENNKEKTIKDPFNNIADYLKFKRKILKITKTSERVTIPIIFRKKKQEEKQERSQQELGINKLFELTINEERSQTNPVCGDFTEKLATKEENQWSNKCLCAIQ